MGAVYTRTSDGYILRDPSADEISGLGDRYFRPYAEALSVLVDERLESVGGVTMIDLHSYPRDPLPYELHSDVPRPEICLGTDPFHTPDTLTALARLRFGGYDTGIDSPFAGCYVPLKHYGRDRAVRAIMLELRRDLYLDEAGEPWACAMGLLAVRLSELLDELDREPFSS